MYMYAYTGSMAMCARTRARCAEYLRGGTLVALYLWRLLNTHTHTHIYIMYM